MKLEAFDKAIAEAKRFLNEAAKVKVDRNLPYPHVVEYTAETGSVKRASLDLTRALAKMRLP